MRVAFHTLGCKVNQYETEAMKESFKRRGHSVVDENDYADAYVINTCTVTNLADRKSRQYIRRAKRVNPTGLVAVTGCYAQIKPEEVSAIEGVDIVVGTNEKHNLIDYVEDFIYDRNNSKEVVGATSCHVLSYDEMHEYQSDGVVTSMESRTRAYIKIQEGCNRFCSYCIIPFARGPVRSRQLKEILKEAEILVSKGFKEIILTGINTALYGEDLGYDGISKLIGEINNLPGDFRIRLSSLEPTVIDEEYVKKLFGYDKLCHHLHLSIQSGSDKILARMNRRYDREKYLSIVETLRRFDPLYGISTDIICGFPGECEEDFMDSVDIVRETGFCKVHVFRYSKRTGTKAASMEDQVGGKTSQERSERLTKVVGTAEREFFKRNIGTQGRVLIEEKDGEFVRGYTGNYIRVYLPMEFEDKLGCFVNVMLTEIYRDGMKGESYE
ncbi:MAG: tRNA (N(6)-L-threonylcarbamoyladenosine(37)-C(2))-methylthiotransferase MtaB [Clostridiales bacterium]|nr:tRNA (N(6)-L-threonylcarbamoyladenosine(37)-C(2))-methylthiotransferase MtaB [Clostridiales bacterium]